MNPDAVKSKYVVVFGSHPGKCIRTTDGLIPRNEARFWLWVERMTGADINVWRASGSGLPLILEDM